MKIMRISEHIWKCQVWLLIPISIWIVRSNRGLTLVDAGIPWMAGGLLKQIERMELPLERILLTHGHSDHVGGIKRIRQQFPVPVYAHSLEIPYMEGKHPYLRRSKAETTVEPGLAQPLDAWVDEVDPLNRASSSDAGPFSPIGSSILEPTMLKTVEGLTPYLTPGHSPGHVVYYHEADGILLAGDLFTSSKGKLKPPMAMFTGDMQQALESSKVIELLKPKVVSVCHGGEVLKPYEQYGNYIETVK
jgi:glyoxylase-like metal-dependent hydrolase (beta-lactamase superfamily II)